MATIHPIVRQLAKLKDKEERIFILGWRSYLEKKPLNLNKKSKRKLLKLI